MNGVVSTFAGSYDADTTSGSPYVTRFVLPIRLAIDNDGAVFTLDVNDPRVRKLSAGGFSSVAAGNGTIGFEDGNGAIAKFGDQCSGVVSDEHGNIYVVDWKNRRIRKISTTGQVTTVAGNGQAGFVDGAAASAQFFNPSGIAIDIQGNLFVGDGTCIRKITPGGIVSTFAGKDSVGYRDGLFNEALFSSINDLVVNYEGIIYLTDGDRIRKITPQGMVSTLAGSGGGFADGDAASAKFLGPVGLDIDKEGNIYVADDHNNRIRKISFE
jgi:sugar lactone lactonase YvrE